MEYKMYDDNAYKLHMIKTDKFKTITVRVSFRTPIKKNDITIRNILCDMFTQSTKKYSSKRSLTIKAQDLYSAEFYTHNSRLGKYITTDIYLSVLNDKYTEDGNFSSALDFMEEIIFNPDINDDEFNKEKLEIVKSYARDSLNTLKEKSAYYSMVRMFECLGEDEASYRMVGYLEDIDKISAKDVYNYYQDMIKNNLVDVLVIGDIDFLECHKLIRDHIKINTLKKAKPSYILDEVKPRTHIQEVREVLNNSQSKLSIAARVNHLSLYERNYPLTICNIIFGGGVESKLFKKVREENSLCYTISSVPNKLDNLLIIRAGIDRDNYDKTVSEIKKCLEEMRRGNFSEDDILSAKQFYLTALDDLEDSPEQIMEDYFLSSTIGTDTLSIKREKMMNVTKNEIVEVAKKIKLDTIFFLEGDDCE